MYTYRAHTHDVAWLGMGMLARCLPVGTATILDSLATSNYTIYNLCMLPSFGQSAPRKYAFFSIGNLA